MVVLVRDIETVVTDVRGGAVGEVIASPPILLDQILPWISRVSRSAPPEVFLQVAEGPVSG
jgi:hypothetical protein